MGMPLSNRVSNEFSLAEGFVSPATSRRGRGIMPNFAQSYGGSSLTIIANEAVSIPLAVPSLAAGASQTLTATQGLQVISAVNPAATDVAQAMIANTSVSPLANILPGHPQIQVTSNQGTPVGGTLASGQSWNGLAISVNMTVYALTASSAGTITVSANVILMGTATSNQVVQ